MHGACAAQAGAAAELGAGHLQLLADDPEQRRVVGSVDLTRLTVDGERDHVSSVAVAVELSRRAHLLGMPTLFTSSLAGSCSPLLAAVKKRYSISGKRRLTALAVHGFLFQRIRDLVDAGLGADLILLAAGRSGDADRPDHIVANLDRQRALGGDHVAEIDEGPGRVVLDPLDQLARRHAE